MFRVFITIVLFLCVQVTGFSVQAAQKEIQHKEFYLSFDQRVALSFAILAQGQTPAQQEAYLEQARFYFISKWEQGFQQVEVRNFNEFLKHFRGEWPNTQSLALDISILQKTRPKPFSSYVAASPRVQRQIDSYLQWQRQQITTTVADSLPLDTFSPLKASMAVSLELLRNPAAPSLAKKWALAESDNFLTKQIQKLDSLGEEIAKSKIADSTDAKMRILLQTLFTEYFARLTLDSKKLIVSSYLGRNLRMDNMEKLEILIQNSGPQLQKLLQVVARQADLPPELAKTFQKLESSVREVPWVQVQAMLDAERLNYKFLAFEEKPLGVGTMAQVHRAKISQGGERRDVVVRFIKPRIAERVSEDGRILKELATVLDSNKEFQRLGAPKLGPVVEEITATVVAELSQEDTVVRQKGAVAGYNKSITVKTAQYKNILEFHVPEILTPATEKTDFMVQEMVFGQKLDKAVKTYSEHPAELKRAIVEALAKLWISEMMFGSGFYHADLHAGNFLVQITDPKIRLNILDFGMGGTISSEMQTTVMLLGAGIKLRDQEIISKAFWRISNVAKNEISENDFHRKVGEHLWELSNNRDPRSATVETWTVWAMDQGLRLPYEFVNLNRGMVIIGTLLTESGSKLTPNLIARDLVAKHPGTVYQRLVRDQKVSRRALVKMGFEELTRKFATPLPLKAQTCEGLF